MKNEIKNEHKLILLALKNIWSEQEYIMIDNILKEQLDWKEILGQVFLHRVNGIFFVNLYKRNFHRKLPKEVIMPLQTAYFGNSHINKVYESVISSVSKKLNNHKIPFVFWKGAIINSFVYENLGFRTSNDIDILISKESLSATTKVLNDLGFNQGNYDAERKKIIPLSRREQLFWTTQTHQLAPFRKIIEEAYLDKVKIDVNFSLDLGNKSSKASDYLVEDLLHNQHGISSEKIQFNSLNLEAMLLTLSLHASKEATSLWALENQNDLTMYKFSDIHYLITSKEINWELFLELVSTHSLVKEVYYALYYTEHLFGGTVPLKIIKNLEKKISDRSYLNIIYSNEGKAFYQNDTFIDRIFNQNRHNEFFKTNINY